jgi:response regulator RpfG family c-di-GMP phosphodiesterase
MDDLKKYENDFLIRIILVFSGFFVLILAMGIWMLIYFVILPINSMADCANTFAFGDEDTEALENNLKRIMELDIRTDDEIENLYHAFCKLTEDTAVYMENIERQTKVIDEMQKGLIITMADMVEGRDSDTGDHVQKTAAYADIILKGLKRKGYYTDQLTDKFVSDVVQSAPLHDIGKINVSDTILNKPGKLTDEEFKIMKTHATSGRDLLNKAISTVHGESYLQEGRNLATFHHEKWNGRGYPEGLSGEEIPLSARVMAVADVFDALVSKRVYKDAMPFDKAVSIIREDAGTHFDPKVVDAFLDSLDEVKSVLTYYNNRAAEKEAQVQQQEKEEKENEI